MDPASVVAASALAELRARVSGPPVARLVSRLALLEASEPWVVVVVLPVVGQRLVVVPQAEPVRVAWADSAQLAEAVPALAVVEPSRGPAAV